VDWNKQITEYQFKVIGCNNCSLMLSENPKYVIEGFRGKYGLSSNPKVWCAKILGLEGR